MSELFPIPSLLRRRIDRNESTLLYTDEIYLQGYRCREASVLLSSQRERVPSVSILKSVAKHSQENFWAPFASVVVVYDLCAPASVDTDSCGCVNHHYCFMHVRRCPPTPSPRTTSPSWLVLWSEDCCRHHP